MKKHELEFEEITSQLRTWREEMIIALRSPETHDKAIQTKRQIDLAIGCLDFCQRFQIGTPPLNWTVAKERLTTGGNHEFNAKQANADNTHPSSSTKRFAW